MKISEIKQGEAFWTLGGLYIKDIGKVGDKNVNAFEPISGTYHWIEDTVKVTPCIRSDQ